MRLSDVMSHAGLSGYAQVALLLFMGVFIAIVIRVFAPSRTADMNRDRQLPFADGEDREPHEGASR